jgi:hypothetical protein
MNRSGRAVKLALAAAIFLAALFAAFVAGARVGVTEFLYADAQYKAAILAWQLSALRAGKPAEVMQRMESSLDLELGRHGRYLDSRLTWLWPDMKADNDDPILDGVYYRLSHPHTESEADLYRDKVLTRYGVKAKPRK